MTYRRMRTVVAVVLVAAVVTVVSVIVARSDGRKHATVPRRGLAGPCRPPPRSTCPGSRRTTSCPAGPCTSRPRPDRRARARRRIGTPPTAPVCCPLARCPRRGWSRSPRDRHLHRGSDQGGRFPGTVEEVTCAAGFAVRQARTRRASSPRTSCCWHSAGGHLAALAALAPSEFRGSLPLPGRPGSTAWSASPAPTSRGRSTISPTPSSAALETWRSRSGSGRRRRRARRPP